MGTTNILDLNNRVSALEKSAGASADSAKRSDIATEFSATTAYTAGCFVYHEGQLYIFNADHAAGAWDATEVAEVNVTYEVTSNKAAIDALDDRVDTVEDTLSTVHNWETVNTVTADGVKTYSQLISELNTDMSDATDLSVGGAVLTNIGGRRFGLVMLDSSLAVNLRAARASENTFKYVEVGISTTGVVTYRNLSDNVVSSGTNFSLVKKH